jgi:hypothetical protein
MISADTILADTNRKLITKLPNIAHQLPDIRLEVLMVLATSMLLAALWLAGIMLDIQDLFLPKVENGKSIDDHQFLAMVHFYSSHHV